MMRSDFLAQGRKFLALASKSVPSMQIKRACAWGCSRLGRAAVLVWRCVSDRPLPKSRLALNVSALPVFSGATRSVPQFSLEFYMPWWCLLLLAAAVGSLVGLVATQWLPRGDDDTEWWWRIK